MQKCVSDYLDLVCTPLRNKVLRQAARSELTDHIMARCKELTAQGWDAEPAAKETVAQMGDPADLGKRIAAANRPRSASVTLLVGIGLALLGLLYITWSGGGSMTIFIDIPSFIAITVLSSAYGLISCGSNLTTLTFLRGFKTGALYSGVLCSIIGCVLMLHYLYVPSSIGPGFAVALMSIVYGCLFSAAASAAENRYATFESDTIRNLLADIPSSIPTNHVQ